MKENNRCLKIALITYKDGIPKKFKTCDTTSDSIPRFVTKKRIEVNDQSGGS